MRTSAAVAAILMSTASASASIDKVELEQISLGLFEGALDEEHLEDIVTCATVDAPNMVTEIEAAVKLGISKIIIASSETTYGICFSDGKTNPKKLPLEEDYEVDPMDSYGLSKVVNEKTAQSFQRRSGFDIYALRIGNVIEPHEYAELFPHYFKNPQVRRRNAFCYIDARDLGQIVDLCLKKDDLGYQIFNAGNDQNGAIVPSKELAEAFFPNVPIIRELEKHEALFSNRKIREVLGFKEQHNWQKYLKWE